jgi:hypothetical protein
VRTISSAGKSARVKAASKKIASSRSLYPGIDPISTLDSASKIALLEKVEQLARAQDKRVVQVMAGLASEYDVVMVARADGTLAADVRPLVRLSLTVIAEHKGRREVGSSGGGGRFGLDHFDDALVQQYVREAVSNAVTNLDARPAPAGEAIVVRVTLEREGSSLESARTSVRATGAGLAAAPSRTVNWESGQAESTVDFQLLPGGAAASNARRVGIEVSIDDDALALGNSAYAAVDVHRDLEVGVIGRRSSIDASDIDHVPASLWIARALSPAVGSGMRVREIDPSSCDERALLGLDAIVVARPDLVSPSACDALGKFAEATSHYERSFAIYIQVHGTEEHANVATSLNNLGLVLEAQGRYAEAAQHLERSLAIYIKVHGTEEHPDVAHSLNSMGNVLREQGRLAAAVTHHERSLAIELKVHCTEEHPDVSRT